MTIWSWSATAERAHRRGATQHAAVESKQRDTRFLWFDYKSSETKMWFSTQVVTLNESIYSGARGKVLDKLGRKRDQYIDDLDI